jgi:hypothetical protein
MSELKVKMCMKMKALADWQQSADKTSTCVQLFCRNKQDGRNETVRV